MKSNNLRRLNFLGPCTSSSINISRKEQEALKISKKECLDNKSRFPPNDGKFENEFSSTDAVKIDESNQQIPDDNKDTEMMAMTENQKSSSLQKSSSFPSKSKEEEEDLEEDIEH